MFVIYNFSILYDFLTFCGLSFEDFFVGQFYQTFSEFNQQCWFEFETEGGVWSLKSTTGTLNSQNVIALGSHGDCGSDGWCVTVRLSVPVLCNLKTCCVRQKTDWSSSIWSLCSPLALLQVLVPGHLDVEVGPAHPPLACLGEDTLIRSIQRLAAQGLPRVSLLHQLSGFGGLHLLGCEGVQPTGGVRALPWDHGGLGLLPNLGGGGGGHGGGGAAARAQRFEAGEVARSRGGRSYQHPVLEDRTLTPGGGGGVGHRLLLAPDHVGN